MTKYRVVKINSRTNLILGRIEFMVQKKSWFAWVNTGLSGTNKEHLMDIVYKLEL
jgi:hypothetical protein